MHRIKLFILTLFSFLFITSGAIWEKAIAISPYLYQTNIKTITTSSGNSVLLLTQSAYDAELLKLTNAERQKFNLPPLTFSPQLGEAAQRHVEDMVRNNYFSHTGLNGSQPADRVQATGYSSSYIGENIAAGMSTPRQTIQQWMNSPGHRSNILKPEYKEIGFGYVNDSSSQYRYYWVQVFGTPISNSNSANNANNSTSAKESLCTCWVSDEQAQGKVWDCRLWGKMNGWGWWWFSPQGQQPSRVLPDEVQDGTCKVTDGRKELEEQRLGIDKPPKGINTRPPSLPNNLPPSSNPNELLW